MNEQEKAQPVAWLVDEVVDDGQGGTTLSTYAVTHDERVNEKYILNSLPLYTTPPTPPTVAMAYKLAAEACNEAISDWEKWYWVDENIVRGKYAEKLKQTILALTPADAEKALEELCMKVAREVWPFAVLDGSVKEAVQRVIKGE